MVDRLGEAGELKKLVGRAGLEPIAAACPYFLKAYGTEAQRTVWRAALHVGFAARSAYPASVVLNGRKLLIWSGACVFLSSGDGL